MKILFYGGNIITMAKPLSAEAVLVEDGRIVAVGDEQSLRCCAGECEEVDLAGKTLMPGFIDAHSHFSQVAMSFLQASFDGVSCVSQMAEIIRAFVEETGTQAGQWISARDYDNNIMPLCKNPTLKELDEIAPHNPLVIHHKSGHMGLLNSLALAELGITEETEQVEGGKIEFEKGKPTGYMEENAFFEYLKKVPMPTNEQLLRGFEMAQDKYASYGITTFQEGMFVEQMIPLYKMIFNEKLLKLDLVAFPDVHTWDKAVAEFGRERRVKHFKLGGIKAFLDGSPQGRTAWMRRPYADDSQYCGYGTLKDEELSKIMEKAASEECQLICHCNGDGAAQQFISCLEKIENVHPEMAALRPVIIHGQLIGTDQLAKAAKLRAMISFFVAHVYYWGDVHIKNFGFERASEISPVAAALKEGIKFTFHQDAPVINPDMLETVWCAITRRTRSGIKLEQKQSIDIYNALEAITVNGAYQYFEEDKKGTIEVGKQADLVVLDGNPLEFPTEEIRKIKVCATYKDGERVYKA